jgi:hypothetical protein
MLVTFLPSSVSHVQANAGVEASNAAMKTSFLTVSTFRLRTGAPLERRASAFLLLSAILLLFTA